jgi:signal transduction histidine kinase
LVPQVVDLNALLPDQVAMLDRALRQEISVTTTLAADVWRTLADPTQIGEALLNLALNARGATPHGGRLGIETANLHLAIGMRPRLPTRRWATTSCCR